MINYYDEDQPSKEGYEEFDDFDIEERTFTNSDLPQLDVEKALTWVYPTNYPLRDYQLSIVKQGILFYY